MEEFPLPLTPNGNVDRLAVPEPSWSRNEFQEYSAPDIPVQRVLTKIWCAVLGVPQVRITDNFFTLGGDSLLAIQVVAFVRDTLQVELPLRDLFENPTIVELSSIVENLQCNAPSQQIFHIQPVPRDIRLPLSYSQERIWFIQHLSPENRAYRLHLTLRFKGPLNSLALEQSLNEIVRRHEVFRTTFPVIDGTPIQLIHDAYPIALPMLDIRSFPENAREEIAQHMIREEFQKPLDLAQLPLIHWKLLVLSEQEHLLVHFVHHLLHDAWSFNVFLYELRELYNAFSTGKSAPLPELSVQFADFAYWQRQWVQGEEAQVQLAYWNKHLAGSPPLLVLPTDRPRPEIQTFRGAMPSIELPLPLCQGLRSLSRQEGVTLFMTLLAAFKVLLYRYSGQSDICVGTAVAARRWRETEGLVGMIVNNVVLRTNLSGNPSFHQFLQQVRTVTLDGYMHQDVPFDKVVETLQPERNLSYNPLFQVMFTFHDAPLPTLNFSGLTTTVYEGLSNGSAKFDINAIIIPRVEQQIGRNVSEEESGITMLLEYNLELFDDSTIQRMLEHYQILLEGIVTHPETSITLLPLLTQSEREQILVQWNTREQEYSSDVCIHELIEKQVERTPEAVAVIFENERLSYQELDHSANQIAHHLRSLGVGPEVLVGICVERSLGLILGLLAVLKAGGAYVPLDPTYPTARLAFMLQDANIAVLLTQQRLVDSLPHHQASVVCLDTPWQDREHRGVDRCISMVNPAHLAYVIYTSGSTGLPKGTAITHRAVVNCLLSMGLQIGLTAQDTLLAITSLSFDIAVLELLLPLTLGACVKIASQDAARDGVLLAKLLTGSEITVMQATPATWHTILAAGWIGNQHTTLLCGGETLTKELAALLLEKGAYLWNLYGPTETTIWSTSFRVTTAKGVIAIGRPIHGTQIYVLDTHLQPVPVGIVGEVYIGGVSLARGYLKRPDLTAERFIPHPLTQEPRAMLYRTGDLARYLPDGNLQYIGRIDQQVKVRGFRIELGEIEAVLGRHPAVQHCVVVVREDTPGDARLVAYIVAKGGSLPAISMLRGYLQEQLPGYMVPSTFVMLDEFPLTPNYKVDRLALPKPEEQRPVLTEAFVAPHNEIERNIVTIWQDVLRVKNVGIQDNFFDLGGHSLLMIQLHNKLQERLNREVSLLDLFKHPTVHSLAKHLNSEGPFTLAPQSNTQNSQERRITIRQQGQPRDMTNRQEDVQHLEAIAVIGMAGRFPGAQNVDELWHNLCHGIETISQFSDQELFATGVDPVLLGDDRYVRTRAVLEDIEQFDAAFFGFTPRDAELTDPQQRIFLECAWEALEHAGYNAGMYTGRIGVYAGSGLNTYLLSNLYADRELIASTGLFKIAIGNDKDNLTTRTSYKLNLKGPSISVNTMCSTSLVAIHLACQSLANGECEMALAGGVRIKVPAREGYLYQEGGIHSPDGHCRAFDADAQGTVGGDGVGIVVLKRLKDALADGDTIHAIVRGSAINNDGAQKVGYTAPSINGQAQVIAEAQTVAGVEAETITYVEAHGTGTPLGDPIEIAALTQAFRINTNKKSFCAIRSVKSNVGHLDAAAGVTGFITTVLALKHGLIPPSLHFRQPNPQIDFANSPFYVNDKLSTWKTDGAPRRAGVSSFGIGGTNAHAVLEEAPLFGARGSSPRPYQLVTLSARSDTALATMRVRLARHLREHPTLQLADVAYTLQVGRKVSNHRIAFTCQSLAEAISVLETQGSKNIITTHQDARTPTIVYMFPGQGAQHSNMAEELYRLEPTFRKIVDRCAELLKPHLGVDIRRVLYPQAEQVVAAERQLKQTAITQPLLFTVEYALAKLWMDWVGPPWAMIGHSLGEYVAACLAGVFSLEDALALVATRGRLIQALPAGAMLAIPLPPHKVNELLSKEIALAAVNGSSQCVVSGLEDAIIGLSQQLEQMGIVSQRLETSHAFHSAMMDPIVEQFIEQVKSLKLAPPMIPYVSGLTGTWITSAEATDPRYWGQHLRHTVRFADGVQALLQQAECILLEIGPGQSLSSLVKRHPARSARHTVLPSLRYPSSADSDIYVLLNALGHLWLENAEIDWPAFYAYEQRLRIPLPTYPFERKRYWIDPPQVRYKGAAHTIPSQQEVSPSEQETAMSQEQTTFSSTSSGSMQRHGKIASMLAAVMSNLLGIAAEEIDQQKTFLELGAESLLLLQASNTIYDYFGIQVPFRLLLDQYPTIAALARHINQQLPPERFLTIPHATQTEHTVVQQNMVLHQAVSASMHKQLPTAIDSSATSVTSETRVTDVHNSSQTNLEQIITLQLQVMSQQLAILGKDTPSKETLPPAPQTAQFRTEQVVMREQIMPNIPPSENRSAYFPRHTDQLHPIKGLNEQQQQCIEMLITRFNRRTQGSKNYTQTYRPFLADGKTVALFKSTLKEAVYPIVVQKGAGSRVWDVDQNEYIDIAMGSGALLFGHSPSFLADVLGEQVKHGVRLGPQSDLVGKAAKLLCETTGKERAFFCNSGTEAIMTALRLARTVTGRNKIAMFVQSYHGTFDGILAHLQETDAGVMSAIPLAPGIPPHMVEDVIVLHFGQPESLQTLKAHAHTLGAVLVEPVQSRRPDLQPIKYLHALRQITEESGAALIFDEVVTGFRSHPGGVQALFGLQADLTTYGKALGGGMPVAAIAGKATYMDAIDGGMWNYGDTSYPRAMQTFVTGTYFKHPFVMGVVWAVLNHMRESGPELQQRLSQRTSQLAETLNTYFLQEQVPIRIAHFSSLFRFVFLPESLPIEENMFFYHLLEKGIYVGETRNCFLSTAHTEEDIVTIVNIVKESVVAMRAGGFFISHIRARA